MVPASRAYLACRDLFNEYPLAVSAVNHVPTMHTMVLMLRDGDDVRFFVLMRIRGKDITHYTLSPWRAEGAMEMAADGGEVPEPTANAVEQGIPLPRDGLLFGWAREEMVTAPPERAFYSALPYLVPVWRGCGLRGRVRGLSWTTV